MTKPRPAPAKPAIPEAPPTPPPQASEQQQPQGVDANASTTEGAADGSGETPASAEPMDTEISTTSARCPDSESREELGGGPIMKESGVCPPLSGL